MDYGSWALPPLGQGFWAVASPSRIRNLIVAGQLKQFGFLGDPPRRLLAFNNVGDEKVYVDPTFLTQCRDMSNVDRVFCTAVAKRRDWSFGFAIGGGQAAVLPALLTNIEAAVEATRSNCPR